jgi:hypothetical protein
MKTKPDDAIKFLRWLRPGGPWVLTAIEPDGPTTTITAKTPADVRDFVGKHDGKRNLYFTLNPTKGPISKKPTKQDIGAVEFVHADLDPRDDESPKQAKERYRAALKALPKASALIDSGNGLQALWRFEDCPKDFATVEAVSKGVMLALGGKAGTQNVDRLLRLPGTENLPNAAKRRAGRTRCRATLADINNKKYALDDFPRADNVNDNAEKDRTASGLFHRECCRLFERGWSFDLIERDIRAHPSRWEETSAPRYRGERRLRRELERCHGTWGHEHPDLLKKWTEAQSAPFERALDDYEELPLTWLWQYLVPENTVVLLEGEGEAGKSRFARYIVARLSSGRALPGQDESNALINCLICSFSEDPVAQITRPQIRRMGGDLERVFVVDAPFTLDEDGLAKLEDVIARRKIKLVVLDPLADYIPSKANAYRDEEVRRLVMGPLSLLARKHAVTILAIRHFKKGHEDGVKYRGLGSAGFSNVARVSLAFIADPTADADDQIFVVGPNKGNWVPKSKRRYLRFQIRETTDEIGALSWLEDSRATIEELDRQWHKRAAGGEGTDAAKRFIKELLKDGAVPLGEIKAEWQKRNPGFSWPTVERARQSLGVVTRGGHRGRPATWSLPEKKEGTITIYGVDLNKVRPPRYH